MSWNFTLANYGSVWHLMVQIGLLLLGLLIGNVLRNIIPFFKKSFIPSALIGGFFLLISNIILNKCGVSSKVNGVTYTGFIDKEIMQVITYHALGIGFVALSLKTNKIKGKAKPLNVFQNGALTGGAYMLQAFLGLAITIVMYLLTKKYIDTVESGKVVYYACGVILPLGYGQGPGNALTWDINFTDLWGESGLFTGNGSFGLSIASIGFIVACVFGVIYINICKHKGEIVVNKDAVEIKSDVSKYEDENEIPDNESVDKFSIQLGIVALAYAISFGIMCLFGIISDFTNSIAWGFNFIWGVISATLIKLLLNFLRKKNIVKRQYINNYQMDRISGFAFDFMIVAGVAAIEIEDIKRYIWPIVILCIVGAFSTYFYCRFITKRCFKGFEHQMFVTNFGTVTGTASNGMILLKEIDPNFETPASNLFVLSQFPAMIFVAPLLLLLNFTAKSFTNACIACGIFFALFIAYTLFLLISTKKTSSKEEL